MNKNAIEKIIEMLQKEKIGYFRKDLEEGAILLVVPYHVTNEHTKIEIEILGDLAEESFVMSFSKIISNENEEEVNRELLDMNAGLAKGRLAVKKSTKEVNYSMTVPLPRDKELSISEYRLCLQYCFFVYFTLCEKGIIEKEQYVENDQN